MILLKVLLFVAFFGVFAHSGMVFRACWGSRKRTGKGFGVLILAFLMKIPTYVDYEKWKFI